MISVKSVVRIYLDLIKHLNSSVVEQWTENPCVIGSNPILNIYMYFFSPLEQFQVLPIFSIFFNHLGLNTTNEAIILLLIFLFFLTLLNFFLYFFFKKKIYKNFYFNLFIELINTLSTVICLLVNWHCRTKTECLIFVLAVINLGFVLRFDVDFCYLYDIIVKHNEQANMYPVVEPSNFVSTYNYLSSISPTNSTNLSDYNSTKIISKDFSLLRQVVAGHKKIYFYC